MTARVLSQLPAQVAQAITDGRAGDLEERHIGRAEAIEELDDGRVRFVVVRHPHLLGRPSVGRPSPAFKRVVKSYEWSPITHVVVSVETVDGDEDDEDVVELDVEPLAAETVAQMAECGLSPDVESGLASCQTANAAEECAHRLALGVEWADDGVQDALGPGDRRRYVAACVRRYALHLVEVWHALREDD